MTEHSEVRPEDLHAWIDCELDESRRARVEAAVETDPELREIGGLYRADKARILSLYGGGLHEPLPLEWIRKIEDTAARRSWRPQVWALTAMAASFVLVLAGALAYREWPSPARNDIVADALAARAEQLPPQAVIPILSGRDADAQAVAMTRALSARVKAPDLSKMGYSLVAMEVYDSPARSFELRYRDRDGRVFTLYLRRSSGAPRFDQFEENGLRVCIWQDDVIGTVMAGKMSAAEMQRLASLAYTGLTL